jgi:hypothetical protein
MGIYEYQCPAGHITEHFVSLAERPDNIPCSKCPNPNNLDADIVFAKRVLSATPTTFRAMDRKAFKRSGR